MNGLGAGIDRTLGRLTVYRLVVVALAVVWLFGALFAATGTATPFSIALVDPGIRLLALAASLVVAFAGTLVATAIGAAVTRTRTNRDSSLVTALLVALILPPSAEASGLLAIAVAGLVAGASKFVLAPWGRHLFNPAALGALSVGVVGLGYSAWWIGTPPMLPVVVVTGFAVVWRTRRRMLALGFVVLSAVTATVAYTAMGSPMATSAQTALVSLPTLFFAAFMLTEPLTLPPRRWQQLIVGAAVAVLFAVPFTGPVLRIGGLTLSLLHTPELALVVGNLVAFAFAPRRGIRLRVAATRREGSIVELWLEPERPVRFLAGQYLELQVPHRGADGRGARRVFSIASPPGEARLRVAFRMPERASTLKRALDAAAPGVRIGATGVGGDFVLPRDAARPLLLAAGGVGVTPFLAQLPELAGRDAVLLYRPGEGDTVPFAEELAASGVRVVLVDGGLAGEGPAGEGPAGEGPVGKGPPTGLPSGWSVATTVEAALEHGVPGLAAREALVAGSPAFLAELVPALRRHGVRRIRRDAFLGY